MNHRLHLSYALACIVTILIAASSAPIAYAEDIVILVGGQPLRIATPSNQGSGSRLRPK